jgi:hypothetical protein
MAWARHAMCESAFRPPAISPWSLSQSLRWGVVHPSIPSFLSWDCTSVLACAGCTVHILDWVLEIRLRFDLRRSVKVILYFVCYWLNGPGTQRDACSVGCWIVLMRKILVVGPHIMRKSRGVRFWQWCCRGFVFWSINSTFYYVLLFESRFRCSDYVASVVSERNVGT